MKIIHSISFKKSTKKLHRNQIPSLKEAIDKIIRTPLIGGLKIGDLSGIRVYKFHIHHQLFLLAYSYEEKEELLTLLDIGSHENFYRSLK
jgi:addiction module RelE/StbE family toxin